jgi:hypothetical protein
MIDFKEGGSELLQELQSSQKMSASVSGGAAILPVEQPLSPLPPDQLQKMAQNFGLQTVPIVETAASAQLGPWNASITFSGGVPVGGRANLVIFSNGAYNFSGHFHVSGAPSYTTAIVWALKSGDGTTYLFTHSGRVHGTFESGSRDDNWNISNTNPALAAGWNALTKNWTYKWEAKVNIAIGPIVDEVKQIIGAVGTVVAIV